MTAAPTIRLMQKNGSDAPDASEPFLMANGA